MGITLKTTRHVNTIRHHLEKEDQEAERGAIHMISIALYYAPHREIEVQAEVSAPHHTDENQYALCRHTVVNHLTRNTRALSAALDHKVRWTGNASEPHLGRQNLTGKIGQRLS